MPPYTPFLLSIAGLSASLAGLAGLVAAFRGGGGLRPADLYRLREMVEFSFANVLLAIALVPASTILGNDEAAIRMAASIAIVWVVASVWVLHRRHHALGMSWFLSWGLSVTGLNVLVLVAAGAAVMTGAIAAYEAVLVLLLARPMLAFVFVLRSLATDG